MGWLRLEMKEEYIHISDTNRKREAHGGITQSLYQTRRRAKKCKSHSNMVFISQKVYPF